MFQYLPCAHFSTYLVHISVLTLCMFQYLPCAYFSTYLVHIAALTLCIFQHLPCAYFSTYLVHISALALFCYKMIAVFLLIKDFLLQNQDWVFWSKNHWKNTCYKMNGWVFATDSFHNPFFNPKIRPCFWFVVCVGPPIMLWKLTGEGINILHKSQRSCSVSRPLILLCFYNDTVQHLSICEWTSLYTPSWST